MSRPWCFLEMDTVDLSEDRRVIGVTYTLPEQRDQMAVRSCLAIPPTADEVSWVEFREGSEESVCLLIGSFPPLWFWSSLPRTWQATCWYCGTLGRVALSQDVSVRLLVRITTPFLKVHNQPSLPARVGPPELSGPGLDQSQNTSWGSEGKWQRGRTFLSALLPQQYWNWPGAS